MTERNIWNTSWGELDSTDPNDPEFNFLNFRQPNPNAPSGLKTWGEFAARGGGSELAIRRPEERSMTGSEAMFRSLAVLALTKPIKFGGIELAPPADIAQDRLNKGLSRLYERHDIPGNIVFPSKENIEEEVMKVVDAYKQIIPEDAFSPSELNENIHRETLTLIKSLNSGESFDDHETTKEEKALAYDLSLLIGHVPPEEIKERLYSATYASAADIVAAKQSYDFAAKQQRFHKGMMDLRRIPPESWFTLDLTSEILMTKEEKNRLEDVQWAFSPQALHIRRVIKGREDTRAIPLGQFSPSSDRGVYVEDGTLEALDALRVAGTRYLQPVVNKLGKGLGGPVFIRTVQRDEPLATFAVRDPKEAAGNIRNLGNFVAGYDFTYQMMNTALREVDAQYKLPIRPNEVIKRLPSPIVLEMKTELNADGSLNWNSLLLDINERKENIKNKIWEISKNASNWLDEKGNPRKSDQKYIEYYQGQIDYLDKESAKIKDY
jgi:hypothetical protein